MQMVRIFNVALMLKARRLAGLCTYPSEIFSFPGRNIHSHFRQQKVFRVSPAVRPDFKDFTTPLRRVHFSVEKLLLQIVLGNY